MTLAKRIRDIRYAKGWGPDELASRAAISRTALYQIECGKTETPRAGTLRRIAEALEVSIETLLGNLDWERELLASESAVSSSRNVKVHAPETMSFSQAEPVGRAVSSPSEDSSILSHRTISKLDLDRKFHEILESPLGEGLVRIIEESYRLLPRFPERAAR